MEASLIPMERVDFESSLRPAGRRPRFSASESGGFPEKSPRVFVDEFFRRRFKNDARFFLPDRNTGSRFDAQRFPFENEAQIDPLCLLM